MTLASLSLFVDALGVAVNGDQSIPNTIPIRDHVNPATWMLEVIGAGTSNKVRDVRILVPLRMVAVLLVLKLLLLLQIPLLLPRLLRLVPRSYTNTPVESCACDAAEKRYRFRRCLAGHDDLR